MKKIKLIILIIIISQISIFAQSVNITINTTKDRTPISPYIYGVNQDIQNFIPTARRMGGNRMTGYNWENNASNAGSDWYHSSDNFIPWSMGIPGSQSNIPGIALTWFHDQSLQIGAYSAITLQLAGYVAKDKNGTVSEAETAPSARWCEVRFRKNAPLSLTPDTNDNYVYMDECINFLIHRYGLSSSSTGVKGYMLDNEPDLWNHTHPRIHPSTPTCVELIQKSTTMASVIKELDPNAEVFGYCSYGFAGYLSFQSAPDWNSLKGNYRWFIDYYLDQMKKSSELVGRRLLDVLDLHWYPEAKGAGLRICGDGATNTTRDVSIARMQAPRTLWDPTYKTSIKGEITAGEDSWINQWFPEYLPLIPNIKQSIDQYYPGTKLAFTEFNYGGENHISGGIAYADVLGIFGKYGVYFATVWGGDGTYSSAAYNIYLNYNGNGGKYGNTSVEAVTSNVADMPVYASIVGNDDSELHIIVINRNYDNNITANFNITAQTNYNSCEVWGFDENSSQIIQRTPPTITNNSFSYTIPKLSVYHFVLKGTPTINNSPTTPKKLQGKTDGLYRNMSYTYTTYSTDPDMDMIQYVVDWGDGIISTSTLYYSGATAYLQHSWTTAGSYNIKAKAIDTKGAESSWSEILVVNVTTEVFVQKNILIIYDGESSTTSFSYGGGWASPTGSSVKEVTTQSHSPTHSIELYTTWTNWWGGMGYNWAGWWRTDRILDIRNFEAVQFWILVSSIPANAKINFQLKDSTNTVSNDIDITSYLGNDYIGSWKLVEIPLTEFTGIDFSKVWEFQLGVTNVLSGEALLYIDDFGFVIRTTSSLQTYTLSALISPTGSGSITLSPQGGTYIAGTTVTITAVANNGYKFDHWSGDLAGTQNPATIVMNSNKNITANFVAISSPPVVISTYVLTFEVNPQQAGTVNLNPSGRVYVKGTTVTITAVASDGYKFSHWSGDISGTQNPVSVVIDSDKHIVANFSVDISTDDKPQILSINLEDNQVISGAYTIEIVCSDDVGINKVEFYIDGVLVATNISQPYSYVIDTSDLSMGEHTLMVVVYDTSNQTVVSQKTFIVSNTQLYLKDNYLLSLNKDGKNDTIDFGSEIESMKVYDISGRFIKEFKNTITVDDKLKVGLYIYKAKTKDGKYKIGKITVIK